MKNKIFISIILFSLFCELIFGQGTWTQKVNFGGGNRFGVANFSIGNKGYFCAGANNSSFYKDLWEYDPLTDSWTQKASMPLGVRESPVAFTIGNNAYVGMGYGTASLFYTDFWKWNQVSNIWSQIADYPGEGGIGLSGCVGFSIGNKGYVGTGGGWSSSSLMTSNQFWEYDPSTDIWTQKANFAGTPRWFAVGFAINNKGYIGTGDYATSFSDTCCNDFWEYDPSTDIWTQKSSLIGSAREFASAFVIGTKAYIGRGCCDATIGPFYNDLWEWDQTTDIWTQKTNYPGSGIYGGEGFSIGTKGYFGIGSTQNSNARQDFWEFDPSVTGIKGNLNNNFDVVVYPNPATITATFQMSGLDGKKTLIIYDQLGKEIWRKETNENQIEFSAEGFALGLYFYCIQQDGETKANGKFLIE